MLYQFVGVRRFPVATFMSLLYFNKIYKVLKNSQLNKNSCYERLRIITLFAILATEKVLKMVLKKLRN